MSVSAHVEREAQVRFRYGVIAFVAAIFLVASQLVELSGPRAGVTELTVDLILLSKRETLDILGSVLDLISLVCVGVVLNWLYTVTRARNPQQTPVVRWLAVGGAVLAGVMAVAYQVLGAHKAHEFVSTGSQGYPEANRLMSGTLVIALPLAAELGTLLLAMGCVWASLNALRVGLTTRLVGYGGVVAGALFLFAITGLAPLIEAAWLAGLAVTFTARWPSGDPPAWAAGVAMPWPPRAPRPGAAPQRRGRQLPEPDAPPVPKPRAGTPKRKRRRS